MSRVIQILAVALSAAVVLAVTLYSPDRDAEQRMEATVISPLKG